MTALFAQVHLPRTPRRQRAAVTVALGLSAGAVGWSGLANAAGEETASQVLLLPEHYELMDNGVVVFKMETGETLSLTADQYLIMEDGLLLITDELAQASVHSLPVMGSVRAQLLSDLAPVATIDGTVAEATPSQTLAITQGTAPRLSEQVDLQSYEVAQSSVDDTNTAGDALATSMAVAPGAMALLGMLMTSDQPEGETEVEETPTPPAPPAPPPEPEFWTDADVADSASTAITGSSADSFVGYTAASTAAATDPLTAVGKGSGNTAAFDMSAGGDNFFVATDDAARSSGSLSYTGGSGDDSLTIGTLLAYDNGTATFDMSLGGYNTLVAGNFAASTGGSIAYTGGSGNDSLTFGYQLARSGGTATFDMSLGGNNTFVAEDSAARFSGSLAYTGGTGDDSLTFDASLASDGGTATFDMSLGGTNSLVAGVNVAYSSGSFAYTGGPGDDSLTFGFQLARSGGTATLDLSEGGNNTFVADDYAAANRGSISYEGGSGDDSLTFGTYLAYQGSATFDMSAGGNNSFVADDYAATNGGPISYEGGSGEDNLTFGNGLAYEGTATFDLGSDLAVDTVTFEGIVAASGGNVSISNFDPTDGDTIVLQLFSDTADVTLSPSGGSSDTLVSGSGVQFVISGVTTGSLGLTTNSSGHVVITAAPENPEFLSNAMFQALTPTNARAFTGSAGNSFIGYTAADPTAQDALIDAGKGAGNSATFDMSAGGNNTFVAGNFAASTGGSLSYTGGSGDDSLTFGTFLAHENGTATFDMSLGGNNTLVAGTAAASSPGMDGAGGAASFSGSISYEGGSGDDSLTFGNFLVFSGGNATFNMSAGGNNTFVAEDYAASGGSIAYTGGSGNDSLTFGTYLAAFSGTATFDLGDDTAADIVTFQGSIGESGGTVAIRNFNFNHDTIDVPAGVSATTGEITDAAGDLTWTDSGGDHTIVFEEIGTGGAGVVATATQLIADII